jgi:hypothetical protein
MFTVLTNLGRAAIAEVLATQELYMAFGTGVAHWDTTKEVLGNFDALDNTLNVGYTEIDQVVVTPPVPGVPVLEYQDGVDYIVSKNQGVVTRLPGGAIGNSQVRVSFYVKPPSPNINAAGLVAELARKQIISKQFVTPDPQGSIIVQGGARYEISEDPTTFLFVSCTLLEPELSTAVIKEVGVFLNPVFEQPPEPGDTLFTPQQFNNLGKLLTLRNYPAVTRNEAARETFQYVIPF